MCAAPATQVLHSEKYLIISFSYKLVDSTKNTRRLRVSMCCIAYIGYEHRSSKTCYTLNWEMTYEVITRLRHIDLHESLF